MFSVRVIEVKRLKNCKTAAIVIETEEELDV